MRLQRLPRLKALESDERGTAIVELALLAPVLALLTVGIADLSTGFTRRMELSEAVHRTLEKAAAQNFQFSASSTTADYDSLKAETVAAAGGARNGVTTANVVIKNWRECNGVEMTNFNDPCPSGQATARYLQIRLNSYFRPTFGRVIAPNAEGKVPLFAEAAVRIQ